MEEAKERGDYGRRINRNEQVARKEDKKAFSNNGGHSVLGDSADGDLGV